MRTVVADVFGATGAIVALVLLTLAALALRRYLLQRGGGAVDVSVRLRPASHGRGWALGVGRFEDDALAWYRAFSFAPRPRRSFPRTGFSVERQRRPSGPEGFAMLANSVVLECRSDGAPVELAMSESALTGFQAWLESAPPGSRTTSA